MTNLLILAAEEEKSGLDLILPAADELLFGTLCFAVVVFFMMKFVVPKIKEGLEARESTIRGDLESAEKAKSEAAKTLEDYKAQLADARSEANRIVEEARTSAEEVRKDVIAKAEKEGQAIVARAQEQIEAERKRTMQQMRGQVAELSIELAERVVGRSLDKDAQIQLIEDYINEVSAMDGGTQS